MPAFALTAAEIAAAEAAAAAAAEAAAIQAAQVAAAEHAAQVAAAQVAAAEQAAAQAAAQQTATQAAAQSTSSGLEALAKEVGVNTSPTGIDQLKQAFQQAQANNVPMAQADFLNNSFAGPPTALETSQLPPFDATQYLNSTVPGSVPPPPPPPPPLAPTLYGSAQPAQLSTYGQAVGSNTLPPIEPAGVPAGSTINDAYKPYDLSFGQQTPVPGNLLSNAMTGPPTAPVETGGLEGLFNQALNYAKENKLTTGVSSLLAYDKLNQPKPYEKPKYKSSFNSSAYTGYQPTPPTPYSPRYAGGGPIEMMSNQNSIGANTGYPMADISKGAYATPYQTPISRNVLSGASDTGVNPMTGEMTFAGGGISSLGGYSDGGRMLKGPGDGMSDNIPATIANKQPARLANEEFVIPADVVSHLGNGSSEAGAKQLYKMMDRVRQARTGKKAQGKQINPNKFMPK